jgi:hypothetical protein
VFPSLWWLFATPTIQAIEDAIGKAHSQPWFSLTVDLQGSTWLYELLLSST